MKDDALAPVVGMMLILAVIVTVLSLWNGIYLPGLKQQAEVEHLQQVEQGMVRIDSAIGDAMYYRHNGSLSVPIPLGGGDIMLNNLKSGGVLRIEQDENPAVTIDVDGVPHDLYVSNITYTPVSNFWIPQGYSWQYGYVNVSKNNRSTYLTLPDKVGETRIQFDDSFFRWFDEGNGNVTIECVNIIPGTPNITSGNGNANIKIEAITRPPGYYSPGEVVVSYYGLEGVPPVIPPTSNVTIERIEIVLSVE